GWSKPKAARAAGSPTPRRVRCAERPARPTLTRRTHIPPRQSRSCRSLSAAGAPPWMSRAWAPGETKGSERPLRHQAQQELRVRAGLAQLLEQLLDGLDRRHVGQRGAQRLDELGLLRVVEQVFHARARLVEVDGGEDALLGDRAGQHDLHVARALELLE